MIRSTVSCSETELLVSWKGRRGRLLLNGFIWENDVRFFFASHPFVHRLTLLGSRSGKEQESKKRKKCSYIKRNVRGRSDFIEMLYIFHSTRPICVSYMALARYVQTSEKAFGICSCCFWFLLIICKRASKGGRWERIYTSYNPYQLGIKTNCFDTCFIIVFWQFCKWFDLTWLKSIKSQERLRRHYHHLRKISFRPRLVE